MKTDAECTEKFSLCLDCDLHNKCKKYGDHFDEIKYQMTKNVGVSAHQDMKKEEKTEKPVDKSKENCDTCMRNGDSCTHQEIPKAKVCNRYMKENDMIRDNNWVLNFFELVFRNRDNRTYRCLTCKSEITVKTGHELSTKVIDHLRGMCVGVKNQENTDNMATEGTNKIDLMNKDMRIWMKFTDEEKKAFQDVYNNIKDSRLESLDFHGEWVEQDVEPLRVIPCGVYRLIIPEPKKEEPKKTEPKLVRYEIFEKELYGTSTIISLHFRYKDGIDYVISSALNMLNFAWYEYDDGSKSTNIREMRMDIKIGDFRTATPKYVCFWEG